MMKPIITIFIGLTLFLATGAGGAAASQRVDAPRDVLANGPELAPMLAEIKAVLDSARRVETELQAGLEMSVDSRSTDRIRARIADHELDLKIRILEIQARHVRAQGREELALLIETRLAGLKEKRPPIARAATAD